MDNAKEACRVLPVCPDCHSTMVKANEENEEGDWCVKWLCDCEPSDEIMEKINKMKKEKWYGKENR